jgi:uncharacterized protein YqeY
VARGILSAPEMVGIVRAEVDERMSAAAGYERAGRMEQAARLRAEADALLPYID